MIAILSDIHGNYPALEAVLADVDRRGCDFVISLGDVGGYYCMINECINLLQKRGITNLMGNHDSYLVNGSNCPRSNSANHCLAYQRSVLTENNLNYLMNSPEALTNAEARFVHGGWNDPIDEYIQNPEASYFESLHGKYFFSGHTHMQLKAYFNKKIYCNPGSVGQPRDGNPASAYAMFDGTNVELIRVPYDVDRIACEMNDNGFQEFYYSNLFNGTKIGG
jgi:predicted phosphodiesterase